MCVLYTPGGVAGKQAPPATQTGFLYFNSHGKDSAVYACNRAESIKKTYIPHDSAYFSG